MNMTDPRITELERFGVPLDPPEEKTGCPSCGEDECECKLSILAQIRKELAE